ncbi:MAG: P83/100 family protein [Spirochaetia bacterium]|nr:P83/100 family protein [Spirochaetia bacterium]
MAANSKKKKSRNPTSPNPNQKLNQKSKQLSLQQLNPQKSRPLKQKKNQQQKGPKMKPEDEIDQREEELAQRERDIAEERESIAEDQQELIEEEQQREDRTATEDEQEAAQEEETQVTAQTPAEAEAAEAAPPTLPFALFRQQDNQLLGRLALLEPNGQIAALSTLNTIRTREPVDFGEMYVAIAGEDNPPRAVRLVGLNQENLELEQQSETDIYPESPLLIIDNSIYCIIRESGSHYIGKFNTQLQLQQQSDQPVLAYTWLQQFGEQLIAQNEVDSVQRYRISDLRSE